MHFGRVLRQWSWPAGERLALVEVLRRMQALGVSSILVETDHYRGTALALYASLGFHNLQDVGVFRKFYGGTT